MQQATFLRRLFMYEKFFEQAQTAAKPFSELLSLNAKVAEEVVEKQKAFFTDMVNDSVSFAKTISSQKDYSGIYQAQKSYFEGVQSKWIAASTEAYQLMTNTQEKASNVVKSAIAV